MPRVALPGLALSRSGIDRDHEARSDPALFDHLWDDPHTRLLVLWGSRALVRRTEGGVALDLIPVERSTSALSRVYLGRTLRAADDLPAGSPIVLTTLTEAAARELAADEASWAGLREIGPELNDLGAGLFTEALGIVNWHESHRHCPHCGAATVVEMGGWVRRCLDEGREIFPRTDPAVIMGITDDDDRLLLGSNAMWEGNRWSLLAGFVEPGESFEAAVAREVLEEAGVRIVDPEYLGSQPWPFPASVMVGFRARLAHDQHVEDLHPDGEEILEVRWFSRDEIWHQRDEIILPGSVSIARAIIEHWYGGSLDEPPRAADDAGHR